MTRSASGFSLIEAVIAAGVLLATCAAVSAAVGSVARAGARLDLVRRADAAATSEEARLRALPYVRATPSPGSAGEGAGAPSLLAEVFPHGLVVLNDAEACYQPDSGPGSAACFVSRTVCGGMTLVRRAWFVTGLTADGEPVGAARVDGWAVWRGETPPAARLAVELVVVAGGVRRQRSFLVDALRPSAAPEAATGGEAP